MEDLVIMHDQNAVTTSKQVAMAFHKMHKNVIQAIEDKIQLAENSADYQKMFAKGVYDDSRGRQQKMYYMNRDGFTFIAMGFTGYEADKFKLEYIKAFNQMEQQLKDGQKLYYENVIELLNGRIRAFNRKLDDMELKMGVAPSSPKRLPSKHKTYFNKKERQMWRGDVDECLMWMGRTNKWLASAMGIDYGYLMKIKAGDCIASEKVHDITNFLDLNQLYPEGNSYTQE